MGDLKIAIRGGGPGGLYAAILFRRLGHEVTLWERNAHDDTFGFGVVFSDETLTTFEAADRPTYAKITSSFARWGEIDIFFRGQRRTSGGHGFSGLSRAVCWGSCKSVRPSWGRRFTSSLNRRRSMSLPPTTIW